MQDLKIEQKSTSMKEREIKTRENKPKEQKTRADAPRTSLNVGMESEDMMVRG